MAFDGLYLFRFGWLGPSDVKLAFLSNFRVIRVPEFVSAIQHFDQNSSRGSRFVFILEGLKPLAPGRASRTWGKSELQSTPAGNTVNDFLIGVFVYFVVNSGLVR